jgi:hypothetical protein
MNTDLTLGEAIPDSELNYVNFFNGRLLTGGDLSTEQGVNRARSRHLGQAIGSGVAFGLEVSQASGHPASDAMVDVAPGLAVNLAGRTLRLENKQTVALAPPPSGTVSAECVFADCVPFSTGPFLSGVGVYLLTIAPASQRSGLAPMSGSGNGIAACNSRYLVDGIQFRLTQLDVTADAFAPANLPRLRNRVAYQCFGAADTSAFQTDPFNADLTQYGLIDKLRPGRLTDLEVPLAVVFLTATGGLTFVDQWSARRRITAPAVDTIWEFPASPRRSSEADAMLFQFQDQIAAILAAESGTTSIVVSDRFAFLPPIGFLPLASGSSTRGFAYRTFFQNRVYRDPVFIEGAEVVSLVQEALAYPPIDLGSSEMLWLYLVRENIQPPANKPVRTYTIFVNGHTRYRPARYDLNHWNFSNFARP